MTEKIDHQEKWRFHWDQVNSVKKINFLKNIGKLETVKNYKQLSFRRLRVAHGDSILDIGCGLAYDASLLANEVSPTGHIFALDNDLGILSASKELPRSHSFPLGFIQASATELCFSDNQFDGCRVDRVLQHLTEPRKAFEEMVRVTKQQGWIVAIEPDWDTAIVYSQSKREITRTILNNWADTRKSGWIGRELPILFKEHKLRDIRVEYVPIIDSLYTYDWENDFMGFVSSANYAINTGILTEFEAKRWIGQLKRNSKHKIFFAHLGGFLVSGRKN
jgi:ubiquinone/menaquinone biosynthesis C-methylase UbiE